MTISTFITDLPSRDNQPLYWWYFDEHDLVAKGCDADPLLSAGLKLPSVADHDIRFIALLPASASVVRWHPALESINDKQARAASLLSAQEDSIQSDKLHIATNMSSSGEVVTAAADRDLIKHGLDILDRLDIDPDYIVPAGWIIQPSDEEILEIDLGFESLLRGTELIAPNEPALRHQLTAEQAINPLSDEKLISALQQITEQTGLNLRTGDFAKKSQSTLTSANKRKLAWLAAALIIVSLAIPAVRWAQFSWAAHKVDAGALASAETLLGPVDNIAAANKMLDDRLSAKSLGSHPFSVPTAALFSAIQKSPGVTVERLSYDKSGITAATLSAVRNEDINPVLLLVQNAGFLITATPRTDATGTAKADITVRIP